jgi:hypothetical protein
MKAVILFEEKFPQACEAGVLRARNKEFINYRTLLRE